MTFYDWEVVGGFVVGLIVLFLAIGWAMSP
jgi:hypothetical protein